MARRCVFARSLFSHEVEWHGRRFTAQGSEPRARGGCNHMLTAFLCTGRLRVFMRFCGGFVVFASGWLGLGGVGAAVAATSPLAWAGAGSVEPFYSGGGPGGFSGISCASSSFCVAVDRHGFVLTSADPAAGGDSWTPALVDSGVYSLRRVSCPTASLCVAIDGGSTIYTSANPMGGSAAWKATQIPGVFGLESVSCSSASLCVVTEQSGHVVTSTNPTGGAGAWAVADVDASQPITDVSCPQGTTTCVAIDEAQHILTSTNPTGGAPAWTTTMLPGSAFFNGVVTCQSASLCVAVGGSQIFTSANPTGGSGAWAVAGLPAGIADVRSLACPSASLCVLVGDAATGSPSGDMAVSSNPTGGTTAWTVSKSAAAPATLSPIACPSTSLCVALADSEFLTSTSPASGASSYEVSALSSEVGILGISCVTSPSQCVAVDSDGNVAHTTDQAFGTSLFVPSNEWSTTNVTGTPIEGVACPSSSLCAAVDDNGEMLSSRDPTGDASAWSAANVDGPNSLLAISCPSSSLCVATDDAGNVVTSIDPAGGSAAWTAAAADPGNALTAVSCPSANLCVAADDAGNLITSTNPTGGSSSWQTVTVDGANLLFGISCPTITLCVAVDDAGNVITSTNPSGGAVAWTVAAADPGNALTAVSCPTASDCVAVDDAGNAINSLLPSGGAKAWNGTQVTTGSPLYSISCPSPSECVAGDGNGDVYVGKPTPSNSTPPSVNGIAQVGQALQETHGAWTDSPETIDVSWERCDGSGNNCAEISQASGQTHMLTTTDVGHTIRAVEVASNAWGTGDPVDSAPTAVVVIPSPPTNGSPPTVSGAPQQGQALTLHQGSWTSSPTSISDQWQDCDGSGHNCTAISGAVGGTYVLTSSDVGHTIVVREIASNAGGSSAPAGSTPTGLVLVAPGTSGGVTAGRAKVTGLSASIPVSCAGEPGSTCRLNLTLTVVETVKDGKVIGVTAATKGGKKVERKILVLGSATMTLSAGQTTIVPLNLNSTAKRLLTARHRLTVALMITESAKTITRETITFSAKQKKRHKP